MECLIEYGLEQQTTGTRHQCGLVEAPESESEHVL